MFYAVQNVSSLQSICQLYSLFSNLGLTSAFFTLQYFELTIVNLFNYPSRILIY